MYYSVTYLELDGKNSFEFEAKNNEEAIKQCEKWKMLLITKLESWGENELEPTLVKEWK